MKSGAHSSLKKKKNAQIESKFVSNMFCLDERVSEASKLYSLQQSVI